MTPLRILATGLAMSVLATACQPAGPHDAEPVPEGWYDWASSQDKPVPPPAAHAAFQASGTRTGARCLCAPGFRGLYADDRQSFLVTRAPKGYEDTLSKRFVATARACTNCADQGRP